MVLLGSQLRLLLASRSEPLTPSIAGGEPCGAEILVALAGGAVAGAEGQVLRLPHELLDEPELASAWIVDRLGHEARGRTCVTLHPSLWNVARWGPAHLGSRLAELGVRHLSVLLDGSWEQERPLDLLTLLNHSLAIVPKVSEASGAGPRSVLPGLLASLPVPACVVGSSGRIVAAGPGWSALVRRLGSRELTALLDQARERVPVGGQGPLLLTAAGSWFEFWRGPFLPGWEASIWLAVEVTARVGALQAEKRAKTWLERVIRHLDQTTLDAGARARVLAREVREWTGLEEVFLFRREPRGESLSFLAGVPEVVETWQGRKLPISDASLIAWVARSGKPASWSPDRGCSSWSSELLERAGWQRCLCLPLLSQGQTLAVLVSASARTGALPGRASLRELEAACLHAAALFHAGDLFRQAEGIASEWERVFHAVDQPILVVDDRYRILKANQALARIAGAAAPADLTRKSASRILYGRGSPPRTCLIRQVLRVGRTTNGFRTLPHLGGRFLLAVHPLRGPGGAPVGAVLFARNVSREMELEGRFRGVVENSNALFLVADPWGEIQFAAGVWENLLGYSPGEVQGRNLSEFIHPHDRGRVVETFACLGVKPGKIKDFVYRARHREGGIRWHQVTGYSEADENSAPERVYLFISDVTELVKAREESEWKRTELRQQRNMLAHFLAAGKHLYEETDVCRKLKRVCEVIREAGVFRRAVMGLFEPGSRTFCVVAAVGAGAEERSLIEEADTLLSLGERDLDPAAFKIHNSYFVPREARLPGEPGPGPGPRWAPVEQWQPEDLLVVPLRGREKRLIGLLVVDDPPSRRRPTEATVRALELLVQMAVSAVEHSWLVAAVAQLDRDWDQVFGRVPELVAVSDDRGDLLRVNPALAAFLDTSAERLIGRPAPPLLRVGEVPGTDALLDTLLAGRASTRQIEWGGVVLRVSIRPWAGVAGSGAARGAIWVGRLLGESQSSRRSRGEAQAGLAGAIAQDCDTLLTSIQGRLALLGLEAEGLQEQRLLAGAEEACQKLSSKVRKLLDFIREPASPPPCVDLCEICQETFEKLRGTLPEAIVCTLDIPEATFHVRAEREILEALLAQLALDARDAMPLGGELRLRVASRGECGQEQVSIMLEGTARGIEPEELPGIFAPWSAPHGERGAADFRLASLKTALEELGGRVRVRSEPGRGSRFEIELPRVKAPALHAPAGQRGLRLLSSEKQATILVVDDDRRVLDLICNVLKRLGYRCLAASSGGEALAALAERGEPVDAMIVDYAMQGMDGRDLVEKLRGLGMEFPCVLASGFAREALGEGPEDAFLAKPFQIEDVARALEGVLSRA